MLSDISSTCVVLALVAGCRDNTVSLASTASNRCRDYCLSNFSVSGSTLHDCKYSLRDAFQCIAQPNTTLLLYPIQYFYDPGTLPSSAISVSWESASEIQSIKGTAG